MYVASTATPAVIVAVTLSITRTHGYASETAYVSCCFIIFTICVVVVVVVVNDDDDDKVLSTVQYYVFADTNFCRSPIHQ